MIENLSEEIQACRECLELGIVTLDRLNVEQKPYVKFGVEQKWKPSIIKVLFIAESPPWNGKQRYFYNSSLLEKRGLRKEVLKYLNLTSLEEFMEKGYFLIDTIKCRLNKSRKNKNANAYPKYLKNMCQTVLAQRNQRIET